MNIFYLDHDQRRCAEMHNDKHCVKMIVEYAQLLSTAHRVLDGKPYTTKTGKKTVVRWKLNDERDTTIYEAAHMKPPSALWVRSASSNYQWLYRLFECLLDEYTFRYGRQHKSSALLGPLANLPTNIPNSHFTEPTPAMPDNYKVKGSSIVSYRNYYKYGKEHLAKWSKRPVPTFLR